MKTNQSSEDYLETILLLSRESEYVHRVDVARKIGVSQPAVQKAINILRGSGYVECDGMHIYLTPKGQEYATRIYERHCILSKFFISLGVNPADAEHDACEIEHVLSDTTYSAIKKHVDSN
jgi:Mn-dependent DtxR family transcriptional regulator